MSRAAQMIRSVIVLTIVLSVAALAGAQALPSPQVAAKRGAVIFAASCTGYCHGANGAAGAGAPALAGRGFDAAYIEKVIMYGVPGTAMIEWGQRIPKPDSAAVIAYVESLNGLIDSGQPMPRDLSPEAQQGRALFVDSTGNLTGCSNCHQVAGKGIPVAAPIANVPADVPALRNLATPKVSSATVDGRTFPALVASQVRGETKLYDLSVVPPVLLTLSPKDVTLASQSSWQHSSELGTYTDDDLAQMLTFLRALQHP